MQMKDAWETMGTSLETVVPVGGDEGALASSEPEEDRRELRPKA
jgi:hypothetical protein